MSGRAARETGGALLPAAILDPAGTKVLPRVGFEPTHSFEYLNLSQAP